MHDNTRQSNYGLVKLKKKTFDTANHKLLKYHTAKHNILNLLFTKQANKQKTTCHLNFMTI